MSFNWMTTFRRGAWKSFRDFLLRERMTVGKRIASIQAEMKRIGMIQVLYEVTEGSEGDFVATERRAGFTVTPNTSLFKLIQSYIAQGGSPLDISMFLTPDVPEKSFTTAKYLQPYGGVIYPESSEIFNGEGVSTGGWLPLLSYPPRRTGNRKDVSALPQTADILSYVYLLRSWANVEIRTKRNDLEARILKLFDLREQLYLEWTETLQQALQGAVPEFPATDFNYYSSKAHTSIITSFMDNLFYGLPDENGFYDWKPSEQERIDQVLLNMFNYPSLYLDVESGEEDTHAL